MLLYNCVHTVLLSSLLTSVKQRWYEGVAGRHWFSQCADNQHKNVNTLQPTCLLCKHSFKESPPGQLLPLVSSHSLR